MSKAKKNLNQTKPRSESLLSKFNFDEFIPAKHHIWIVLLTIVILFLIFLNPLYFGDKTFQSGDIINMESMKPYIAQEREGFSLWNPNIFCGMPAYAMGTEFPFFNLIQVGMYFLTQIFSFFFKVDYAVWSLRLIILSITSFFLMKYLTKNTLVSLFTAVVTGFSTGLIVFLYIGHVTKLTSLCMYPLIFLMLLRMKEKIQLLDIFILIIALQLFIQGFHVQIIFYTLLAVGIYFVYFFSHSIAKKNFELRNNIIKSAGIFVLASVIAILIQSDNLTQIYEYTPYSTRGTEGILEKASTNQDKSSSDYYDYHTEWSFSPGEVLTFIVPSYFGFGNSTYKGPLTNNQSVEVNTYFGQMRFVDVAMYMGVLVFFLALIAIIMDWKNPFVRYLTILSGFALLVSFGKTFPILFDFLFYYFPYFDKFRVPSMILVLVQMSMPVLAGLGLMKIINLRNEKDKKYLLLIRNIGLVFLGLFILSLIGNSAIADWFTGRINDYTSTISASNQRLAQQYQALAPHASQMFTTDLMMAMAFSAILFWLAYFYIKFKISADVFVVIVILLSIMDLWRIDARGAKYIDNPDKSNLFSEPDYITAIKNQNDKEPFRLLNLKQDGSLGSFTSNSNFNAYFLVEDFYGYSGIKPRAYQDYMDVVGPANPVMWKMLNVKYIVVDKPGMFEGLTPILTNENTVVYQNENVLPRAYLVNRVENKAPIDMLNAVKNSVIDPKDIAFVEEDLITDQPDSTAYSIIKDYKEAKTVIDVNATGNNFLFFGNTYLPGWKAAIDGKETKTYKTNHGFIGIVVPAGKHLVEFNYAPESFFIAKNVSLFLSSLVVLGLIVSVFIELKKKKTSKSK
ncbi:MAG TPA: YfhO family protein [Ignavibacteriaceae bacterium]|nr:YfhO family protein [Ignavibacterium sp.]HRN27091.1 YfhO family protein [Ignavibacteriaceae bacterium]HRP91459.1 YfhO family protein [Ignavibacteriaceae bacterium]HRQ54773.1 YfhO family protein [Ignavibacteriaceae bacterium]